MATGDDLRRIALALAGATEMPHFDRAAFKARRIFATLAADGLTANLRFPVEEQEFRCLLSPEAFSPIPNAWGRQGWTRVDLSQLSEADLTSALNAARDFANRTPRRRGKA